MAKKMPMDVETLVRGMEESDEEPAVAVAEEEAVKAWVEAGTALEADGTEILRSAKRLQKRTSQLSVAQEERNPAEDALTVPVPRFQT